MKSQEQTTNWKHDLHKQFYRIDSRTRTDIIEALDYEMGDLGGFTPEAVNTALQYLLMTTNNKSRRLIKPARLVEVSNETSISSDDVQEVAASVVDAFTIDSAALQYEYLSCGPDVECLACGALFCDCDHHSDCGDCGDCDSPLVIVGIVIAAVALSLGAVNGYIDYKIANLERDPVAARAVKIATTWLLPIAGFGLGASLGGSFFASLWPAHPAVTQFGMPALLALLGAIPLKIAAFFIPCVCKPTKKTQTISHPDNVSSKSTRTQRRRFHKALSSYARKLNPDKEILAHLKVVKRFLEQTSTSHMMAQWLQRGNQMADIQKLIRATITTWVEAAKTREAEKPGPSVLEEVVIEMPLNAGSNQDASLARAHYGTFAPAGVFVPIPASAPLLNEEFVDAQEEFDDQYSSHVAYS